MKFTSEIYRLNVAAKFISRNLNGKKIITALDLASAVLTADMILREFDCEKQLTCTRLLSGDAGHYALYEDLFVKYPGKINLIFGDINDLIKKIPDNSFDLVFGGEIIEHIFDTDSLFDNILRILTKGGIFAGTTPNLVAWFNRIMVLFGENPLNYQPWPMGRTVFQESINSAPIEDLVCLG